MDASDWDLRYAAADLVWSAGPNVWVRELCGGMPPGRALDVAAGEGRNALWLVEAGWSVTAIDYSPAAVARMLQIADRRLSPAGRSRFEARVGDARTLGHHQPGVGLEPDGTASDLVLISYLHLPPEQWREALGAAVSATADGGAVVVVAHARRNLTEGVGGPQEAAILLDPDDLVASAAGLSVEVELAQLRRREVEGAPRAALDTVAVLRRR